MLQVPLEHWYETTWHHTFKPPSFCYINTYSGHAHCYIHYTLLCTPHIGHAHHYIHYTLLCTPHIGHAHRYIHYTLLCTPHIALMVLLHSHQTLNDNITMALSDTGWEGMDWTDLALDTNKWCIVLNNVLSLWVPWIMGNFWTHQRSTGFSRQPLLYAIGWSLTWLFMYLVSVAILQAGREHSFNIER